jgi:glycosyltransferase 2 family protein
MTPEIKSRLRNGMASAIAFGVTGALLYALFQKTDPAPIAAALKKIGFLKAAILIAAGIFFTVFVHTDRLQRLLRAVGCDPGWRRMIEMRMGAMPPALILPMKSGDFLRAFYLKNQTGLPLMRGMALMTAEKTLGLCANLTLFAVGAMMLGKGFMNAYAAAAAAAAAALFAISVYLIENGFTRPGRVAEEQTVPRPPPAFYAFIYLYSVFTLGSEIIMTLLVFAMLGIPAPAIEILYYLPLIQILTLLPISVRGIGVRENGYVYFLQAFAPKSVLVFAGLAVSVTIYIIPTILGFFFMHGFLKKCMINESQSPRGNK